MKGDAESAKVDAMTQDEQQLVLRAVEWAMTEEAANLEHAEAMDLHFEVRECMDARPVAWDRGWRAAARLVLICAELVEQREKAGKAWSGSGHGPIMDEPLIAEARKVLQAELVGGGG